MRVTTSGPVSTIAAGGGVAAATSISSVAGRTTGVTAGTMAATCVTCGSSMIDPSASERAAKSSGAKYSSAGVRTSEYCPGTCLPGAPRSVVVFGRRDRAQRGAGGAGELRVACGVRRAAGSTSSPSRSASGGPAVALRTAHQRQCGASRPFLPESHRPSAGAPGQDPRTGRVVSVIASGRHTRRRRRVARTGRARPAPAFLSKKKGVGAPLCCLDPIPRSRPDLGDSARSQP